MSIKVFDILPKWDTITQSTVGIHFCICFSNTEIQHRLDRASKHFTTHIDVKENLLFTHKITEDMTHKFS